MNAVSTYTVARTPSGSGLSRVCAVSAWNSRASWAAPALLRRARERNDFMRRRPGDEMPVLLVPEPAVDVAAVEQFLVRADVVNAAALEDEDRIRIHQRGEAVRDDNKGAALRDAQQVGV